jgi:hypothetical protein
MEDGSIDCIFVALQKNAARWKFNRKDKPSRIEVTLDRNEAGNKPEWTERLALELQPIQNATKLRCDVFRECN